MYTVRPTDVQGSGSPSGSADPPPPPRQRRKPGRVPVSCAECRRLKLRCDRKVPCETCTKRGCAAICPNGSLATGRTNNRCVELFSGCGVQIADTRACGKDSSWRIPKSCTRRSSA
ncbi:hypothetical protein EI94DRAFT_1714116 [Lactarius quietus]|nr:hypothetical protein EI94DRAFT_1714116 [Lactarius quietus]